MCLDIAGKLDFSPENQRKAFCNYYEDLSMPKEEPDNSYMDLCKIRQDLIDQNDKDNL